MNLTPEQLFEQNTNLVHWCILNKFPTLVGNEDVRQEGFIGLWKACRTYSQSKSAFATYAVPCIMNNIRMLLRKESRNILNSTVSLDAEVANAEGACLMEIVEDPTSDPECSGVFFSSFFETLPPREKKALALCLRGVSQSQAAKQLGVSQPYYSRILKGVRAKCLKYIDME